MRKVKGAEALVDALAKEGVEYVFGITGGAIMTVYDYFPKYPSIKVIMTRHEQAAAHAADGYARATGKVGVAMATSGPGSTNLITGIATAFMDSSPIVAITGQVPTTYMGNDAFQETDTLGITRPITKHNYLLKEVDQIQRIVKEAFYIARSGRPGPVVLDFPKDVQFQETEINGYEQIKINLRGYKPVYKGHPEQIKKAARLIAESKKPVLYIGGGVIWSEASKELMELAEKTQIPVTATLMGLGAFPATHKLFMGMLGMHGTKTANLAMTYCDLIIAVGARFDDRVTGKLDEFAPNAKIIHIDIDPSSIGKNVQVDVPIVGDVKEVLKELLKIVKKPQTELWLKQVEEWKEKHPLVYKQDEKAIAPQYVVEELWNLTKGEAVIATDVGQHQMWVAQYYKFTRPRTLITSGGLGTMGFGFPAAIGAKLGRPDEEVWLVTSEGSFQMNMQELATAVQYNIPVKIIILNNAYLGMVRQWQELFYQKRYVAVDLSVQPNFVKLAEAYGIPAKRIEKPEEVKKGLSWLKNQKTVAILDVSIAREENVFPMVPAGAPLHHMLEGGLA